MKYFTRFLNLCLFIFVLTSLAACKTMRTSEKAVSESEMAAVTASRLTFYRTLDSLSRQFHLSADSIIMIFSNASSLVLPTVFPSGIEGELKDSVAVATQSHKLKSAKKQKTAPPATYTWLSFILIIIFCISMAIILIRFIHKHTFLI